MLDAFSDSYSEARSKFLDAARAAGAHLAHYRHPEARGPREAELFFDVAVLGPRTATRRLLVGCGTHGIEGYSGSAAQTRDTSWLQMGEDPGSAHSSVRSDCLSGDA